jgi:AcrR family transcriptional regulator
MTGTSPPPLKSLRRVASFFEAQLAAGRIAKSDPEVLARAYLGALHSFVLLELLEAAPGALSPDAFVREHVRLLWEGIAPPRAAARARQKRPVRVRSTREIQAKT